MAPDEVERIIRLVASHVRAEVHGEHPIISAELPPHIGGSAGERFEGALPPVATAPCFSIRKPAQRLYTLDDYVADGLMGKATADALRAARSEEHTSELQSLMRISYAVFCLKKQNNHNQLK